MMLDASEDVTDEDLEILRSVADLDHIVAVNKIDKIAPADVSGTVARLQNAIHDPRSRIVTISAKTGEGLEEFQRAVVEPYSPRDNSNSGFLVTDARHNDLLVRAAGEIKQSSEQLSAKMSEEIVLIGLHNALRYLGQITGETTTEDILTRIFSTFCIGK
jgi:tRNA modification GTPase